jgi:hypothetical protein
VLSLISIQGTFVFPSLPGSSRYLLRARRDARAGQPYFLGGKTADGYSFVVLFSDRDLAERFIDLAEWQDDAVAVQLPCLRQLVGRCEK